MDHTTLALSLYVCPQSGELLGCAQGEHEHGLSCSLGQSYFSIQAQRNTNRAQGPPFFLHPFMPDLLPQPWSCSSTTGFCTYSWSTNCVHLCNRRNILVCRPFFLFAPFFSFTTLTSSLHSLFSSSFRLLLNHHLIHLLLDPNFTQTPLAN